MYVNVHVCVCEAVLTTACESSKLQTGHACIIMIKEIVTDAAPGIVDADLQSALTGVSSTHESQVTMGTVASNK